jgi:molybdenum cofactor cytidylyltransferase
MITGIILAAGQSKRMGQPKQLLPFRGETLLGTTLALAKTALDDVVVVLGADAPMILKQIDLHGTNCIIHPGYTHGLSSSLLTGLRAIATRPEITAAVILLGDQPTVRVEAITALCQHFYSHPDIATIVPHYGNQAGNPVLFAKSAWPILETRLTGDEGARRLIAMGEPAPIAHISLPVEWWPDDIDTWDDYYHMLSPH